MSLWRIQRAHGLSKSSPRSYELQFPELPLRILSLEVLLISKGSLFANFRRTFGVLVIDNSFLFLASISRSLSCMFYSWVNRIFLPFFSASSYLIFYKGHTRTFANAYFRNHFIVFERSPAARFHLRPALFESSWISVFDFRLKC